MSLIYCCLIVIIAILIYIPKYNYNLEIITYPQYHLFKNTTKFYIIANISNNNVTNAIDKMSKTLLNGYSLKNNIPHITLLQFEISANHHQAYKFVDIKFHKKISEIYKQTIKNKKLILKSLKNEYDLMGETENKFYVKLFEQNDKMIINNFKKMFYECVKTHIGMITCIQKKVFNNKMYYVFRVNNHDLFAIRNYYFNTWNPHLSIVNIDNMKMHNNRIYQKYHNMHNKTDQLKMLMSEINNKKCGLVSDINMEKHINEIVISLKNQLTNTNIQNKIIV